MTNYKASVWVIDKHGEERVLDACTVAENTREAINKMKNFLAKYDDKVIQITIWEER